MARLLINYDAFRCCPKVLLDELQKTGKEGCIYYQGREYLVILNNSDVTNDPEYGQNNVKD